MDDTRPDGLRMHEFSLVQALLERVEEKARALHANAVHRITVRIGPFAGVEAGLFASAYEMCRAGTLCERAELAISGEPIAWRCPSCQSELPAGGRLMCPRCGAPVRLASGDALVLERIELEVPEDV